MTKQKNPEQTTSQYRPAITPEARENQLISLAVDLVEERLRNGTASSQETTHFLKLASTKAKYEQIILEKQAELIEAKTEAYRSQKDLRELYEKAIVAFKSYQGANEEDYGDED